MNEVKLDEENIEKGSEFFITPQPDFKQRYKNFISQFKFKDYNIKVYHSHSYGEDHVWQRWWERCDSGEGTYKVPWSGEVKVIKDLYGWVSKKPEVLNRILKKAINKIDSSLGLEEENLNAYIAVDKKNLVAVYFILAGVDDPMDSDDNLRQILVNTVMVPEMVHGDERFRDGRHDRNFIDFEIVLVENQNEKKEYMVLYV